MLFIHGGRASGKTTFLITKSAHTGIPILVTSYVKKRLLIDNAKRLGLEIPEPIIWENRHIFKIDLSQPILIDDGEYFLRHILMTTLGVTCDTMAIQDQVIHLNNRFVNIPKDFSVDRMGGKLECVDVEAYRLGKWSLEEKEK